MPEWENHDPAEKKSFSEKEEKNIPSLVVSGKSGITFGGFTEDFLFITFQRTP
jgi:hypothetical protein